MSLPIRYIGMWAITPPVTHITPNQNAAALWNRTRPRAAWAPRRVIRFSYFACPRSMGSAGVGSGVPGNPRATRRDSHLDHQGHRPDDEQRVIGRVDDLREAQHHFERRHRERDAALSDLRA